MLVTSAGEQDSCQQDLGGLLQEDKRDLLVYRLGESSWKGLRF